MHVPHLPVTRGRPAGRWALVLLFFLPLRAVGWAAEQRITRAALRSSILAVGRRSNSISAQNVSVA